MFTNKFNDFYYFNITIVDDLGATGVTKVESICTERNPNWENPTKARANGHAAYLATVQRRNY